MCRVKPKNYNKNIEQGNVSGFVTTPFVNYGETKCLCFLHFAIAHFQKEWQTGAKMGARSIMGSFGGAIARAKTFSLTQAKFQFNNEQSSNTA